MKRANKKAMFLILLFVVLPVCLFAGSFSFQISHAINVSTEYYFEFMKYRGNDAIPNATVSYTTSGDFGLATLAIAYTSNVHISQMDIEVTNLVNTSDDSSFLDYTFHVYKPNDTTVIPFTQESEHGAGTATLFTNKTFNMYDGSHDWNTDEIADFRITIDDTFANFGTYTGYLRFTVTT